VSGRPPAQDQDPAAQDWEERLRQAWVQEPPKLDGRVKLAEYDPGWPGQYEFQATRIRSALGEQILLLEHIGSTSVPGLAAKPVIDILLVVTDPADEQAYVPPLERAGYRLVIREPDWYQAGRGLAMPTLVRLASGFTHLMGDPGDQVARPRQHRGAGGPSRALQPVRGPVQGVETAHARPARGLGFPAR
jgi:GrpB-like predicted nucleotidyltransferase (UPF0157 family)